MSRKLDEREKMELLKMEKIGFWVLFLGLVVSILVQLFAMQAGFRQVAGETIILVLGGMTVVVGGIRNGQEYFGVKHRLRKSLFFGFISALIADILLGIILSFRNTGQDENVRGLVVTLAVSFLIIWLLAFITLFIMEAASHKKQKKLDRMYCEDNEAEHESEENGDTKLTEESGDTEGLRKIATTGNDFELNTVKELLDGQKIPYLIREREAGGYLRLYAGSSIYGTDILVPEELYEAAYEVLDSFPWNSKVLF